MSINNLIAPITDCFSLQLTRGKTSLTVSLCLAKIPFLHLHQSRYDWIHPEEERVVEQLTIPKRKASYLLGRYCAKKALQQISSTPLNEILIGEGVFHQPIFYGALDKTTQGSISHTQDFGGALIFDESQPMSVDIELNNNQQSSTINTQLTRLEQNLLNNQWHPTSKIQAYPWIWTAKEALGKVLKSGLTVPLSVYELKEIRYEGDFIIGTYINFPQYKVLSFLWNEVIVSIVLPRKTEMIFIE